MFRKIMCPFCCVLWACHEMVLDLIRLGGRNFTLHCVLKTSVYLCHGEIT